MRVPLLINVELLFRKCKDELVYLFKDRRKFHIKKYDVIFSFGFSCSTAMFLKNQNLRKFSSPFDWVSIAPFSSRCDIFLNKFENYINKEDLEFFGKRETPEPKDMYLNKKNKICFVHDFPIGGNLDETYFCVLDKYQRRIKRLLDKIEQNEKTLLVYMDFPLDASSKAGDDEIINFINKANEVYNKTHLDILFIRHNENMKKGEFNINQISENAIIAECFNQSGDDISAGNEKNVRKILQFFKLRKQ